MKENSRVVYILIIVAIILCGYFIYQRFFMGDYIVIERGPSENSVTLTEEINLDYVNIYLMSDGNSYISPINNSTIDLLDVGDNLKDRLRLLYDKGEYYNYFVDKNKIKGFKVALDDKVEKIYQVNIKNMNYIVFLKDNNKIGLFDYDSYYNLMYTEVKDNYNNIENVLKIENDLLYYLDGSSIKIEKLL